MRMTFVSAGMEVNIVTGPLKRTLREALSFQHSGLFDLVENPTGFDDREDVAEGAEGVAFVARLIDHVLLVEVDFELVAGADLADEGLFALERDDVATVHRVAEEDAGIELGDDALDARFGEGERRVLPRGAAAEVLAPD